MEKYLVLLYAFSIQIVNDQVFPQIQNGFLDQQPVIREKTVIAAIHLAPKLNFANLDECVVSINKIYNDRVYVIISVYFLITFR